MNSRIKQLELKLKKEISVFLKSQKEINSLRKQIAKLKCPFKVGQRIEALEVKRTIKFIIMNIEPIENIQTYGALSKKSKTSWVIEGPRIKKTDGKESYFRYSISAFDCESIHGNQVTVKERNFEDMLGL